MKAGRWFISVWPLLLLAGCLSLGQPSPPSRFYVLRAPMAQGTALPPGPVVGYLQLATVTVPAYLDRPQLVTRSAGDQLHIAPFDRWGEPLAEGSTRVLAEVLRNRLPGWVVSGGEGGAAPASAWRLQVSMDRFEGVTADRQVVLAAHWSLWRPDGELQSRGNQRLGQAWSEDQPAALVTAMSQVLARCGAELATQVASVIPGG